jgi:hypothetical protein
MTAVIIELPQRFQVVNGASPIGAGTRLLALTVVVSFGSGVSGSLIQRFNIPPFHILLASSCLTTVGLILLSTLSVHQHIESATYGYQVILGLGIGASLGSSLLMIPMVVDKRDMGKLPPVLCRKSSPNMCSCGNVFVLPSSRTWWRTCHRHLYKCTQRSNDLFPHEPTHTITT